MASFNGYSSHNYEPSAPALPENYSQELPGRGHHNPSSSSSFSSSSLSHGNYGQGQPNFMQSSSSSSSSSYSYGAQNQGGHSSYGHAYSYGYSPPVHSHGSGGYFPAGTHPEIIRSFQMVDKDRSGFIEERELQEALSFNYQKFGLSTVRLLMFLFKNPNESLKIGPAEFAALWNCLGEWRGIFERFDKDRSGKIDLMELKDALYSLGYAVPPSVLQVLMSKYDNGSGRRVELNFDTFVECGMIVKGLTEKFKEKDPRYTGSATLAYDEFLRMVIPFLVS